MRASVQAAESSPASISTSDVDRATERSKRSIRSAIRAMRFSNVRNRLSYRISSRPLTSCTGRGARASIGQRAFLAPFAPLPRNRGVTASPGRLPIIMSLVSYSPPKRPDRSSARHRAMHRSMRL